MEYISCPYEMLVPRLSIACIQHDDHEHVTPLLEFTLKGMPDIVHRGLEGLLLVLQTVRLMLRMAPTPDTCDRLFEVISTPIKDSRS